MSLNLKNSAPVDPVLTAFALDYSNDFFIGERVFPTVKVKNEGGTYFKFTNKEKFRVSKTRRAPGTSYARGDLTPTSDTYKCEEEGHEEAVDQRIIDNAQNPFDPLKSKTNICQDRILLAREKRVIDFITDTITNFASYTAALAGTNRWDNDNSEPVKKFNTYAETVRSNCGKWPNIVVLAYDVYIKLSEHPAILDRIKITQNKVSTEALIAELFHVDKILLARAKYNSAEEGQTPVLSDLMSKKIFLGWINSRPGIFEPSVGYNIQSKPFKVQRYPEIKTNSTIVRASVIESTELVAADCGYVVTTVIA